MGLREVVGVDHEVIGERTDRCRRHPGGFSVSLRLAGSVCVCPVYRCLSSLTNLCSRDNKKKKTEAEEREEGRESESEGEDEEEREEVSQYRGSNASRCSTV